MSWWLLVVASDSTYIFVEKNGDFGKTVGVLVDDLHSLKLTASSHLKIGRNCPKRKRSSSNHP